ncbi:hypothetical protein [Staphylococcus sp. 17KM0847]|uniref:hypothetical protein n=1 Tax=Staphylococcus sp. 17KM0847 TaxID=2583989 RepID=UPI0015DC002F|nr:hypothetical protein [Staphylococcus sp. 17KM0847]QLK86086.1 hypothetical protein FGL66_04855 [Staphylococcus sp. 17KM0847]
MKKVHYLSLSMILLLAGCGSQNLLPLEEQSTELREENHELKLTNQALKNENTQKQKQLSALKKDTQNTKKAKANHKIAEYYEIASRYYSDVTSIINAYDRLDSDILKNKQNRKQLDKLDAVIEDHELAVDRYLDDVDTLSVTKKETEIKKQHKELQSIQKKIQQALKKIRQGYAKKEMKLINEGRQALTSLQITKENE